jgi:hypothetical protein
MFIFVRDNESKNRFASPTKNSSSFSFLFETGKMRAKTFRFEPKFLFSTATYAGVDSNSQLSSHCQVMTFATSITVQVMLSSCPSPPAQQGKTPIRSGHLTFGFFLSAL